MGDVPAELCGTLCTGAAQERTVLVLLHRRAADRAAVRQMVGHRPLRALGKIDLQNFRNDLPCLANENGIADADVPLPDEILIVQRGVRHRRARQTDRPHNGLGGQHAGPSHLHHDVLHHGGLDLRGILICRSPLGELSGIAQPFPLRKIVHLDDRAVDIADQLFPVLVDGQHFCINFRNFGQLFVWNHLEFQVFQVFQRLGMSGKFHALRKLDVENINVQSPLRRDFRVELPQRPGGGVPGIGKQGLSQFLLTQIQLFKALFGHENLAPDDKPGGCAGQGHGDGADGFQVFRHVLPYRTVAPGRAPDEFPVHIFQRHGKTVDLRLYGKFRIALCRDGFFQEIVQLFHAEHIL